MNQDKGAMREMPIYQCHKQVWALKIKEIKQSPADLANDVGGTWTLVPADDGYAEFTIPHEFVCKHKPEPGGYYVVYKDGYPSYSPAQAFEEGYSPIPDMKPAQLIPQVAIAGRGVPVALSLLAQGEMRGVGAGSQESKTGQATACKGSKCGSTAGQEHSPECIIEAAITQGWADSDAAREAARQVFKIPKAVMPHIPSQRDLLERELVIGAAKVLAESPQLSTRIAQGIREVLDALHPKVEVTLALDASEKACGGKCGTCASTAAPAPSTQATSAIVLDPLMKMVEERANVAPRVTVEDIEAEIVSEFYFTGADGVLGASEMGTKPASWTGWDQVTFCLLILRNHTKVIGINYGSIDPAQHDAQRGRKEARADAVEQIWPLLGFRLRDTLARTSLDSVGKVVAE